MSIVEEFPLVVVEENPLSQPLVPPAAVAAPAHGALLAAMRPSEQFSPQWVQVFTAMDELRHTLDQRQLLDSHPAVAHDFMAVLAALESLRGDALFEAYWRAQQARLSSRMPNLKTPPSRPVSRGSVYAHQELGVPPDPVR